MSDTTIFMSVGDDSGDLHAANFMREFRKLDPDVNFVGFGMERMRKAGLKEVEKEGQKDSAMWLHNLLRIGQYRERLELCREKFRANPPDLVLCVDFGGFNLYVAREATRQNIPVVYYILPQVWAHGRYRLKKIRKWVTKSLLIYPFEPEIYEEYGVEAEYVGHPLFDHLQDRQKETNKAGALKKEIGQNGVALFPGSRAQEIRSNLPIMLKSARHLKRDFPELQFASVIPDKMSKVADEFLGGAEVDVLFPDVEAPVLAEASKLCLTKSGTITLEIAAVGTPMVIMYKINPFLYFLGCGISDTPYIGLINNLADRMVCAEKAMPVADSEWVRRETERLLDSEDEYRRCQKEMEKTLEGFAEPGASKRAAQAVGEVIL